MLLTGVVNPPRCAVKEFAMVHCLSIRCEPSQRSPAAHAYQRPYGRITIAERLGATVAVGAASAWGATVGPTPRPRVLG
jgi:hypothetical protein